jgi:hypothetical protein
MKVLRNVFFVAATALLLFSCATKAEVYAPVDEAVAQADFEAALLAIETAQTPPEGKNKPKKHIYPEKNVVMLHLDKGVLEHYAEKYDESASDLEEGERLIQEAFTKSATAEVATYIANDNARDYGGEDFEDLFTNILSSLNYYHKGDLEGALVEVRKVDEKLVNLNAKYADSGGKVKEWVTKQVNNVAFPDMGPPANITKSALADYIALLLMRHSIDENERINETRRALVRVNEAINAYPEQYIPGSWDPDLQRNFKVDVPASLKISGEEGYETAEELQIPDGKARLNVIAFAGQSPIKGEYNMPVLFPFRFVPDGELALPSILFRPSAITGVEVAVEGGETFQLDLLEDYDYVVTETFRAKFTNVFLKTYVCEFC